MQFYYFIELAFLGVAVLLCGISFTMNIAYADVFNGYEIETAYITVTDEYYEQSKGRESRTRDFDCLTQLECASFSTIFASTIIISSLGGISLLLLLLRIVLNDFTKQYSRPIGLCIYIGSMMSGFIGTYSIIFLEINNEYYDFIYGTLTLIIIYILLFFTAGGLQWKIYVMERVTNQHI